MVYILLAPGFEEAEALIPADLLRRADIETALVSLEGEYVTGGHAVTVKADLTLEEIDPERAEMIVLPGGGVGVENLGKDPRVEELVRKAALRECRLAAICAAPTLFSRWDLLRGRGAVCYPSWADRLTDTEYRPEEKVVQDGYFITAQAAGASFDFGLKLVEVLAGAEKAEEVRHGIYYC